MSQENNFLTEDPLYYLLMELKNGKVDITEEKNSCANKWIFKNVPNLDEIIVKKNKFIDHHVRFLYYFKLEENEKHFFNGYVEFYRSRPITFIQNNFDKNGKYEIINFQFITVENIIENHKVSSGPFSFGSPTKNIQLLFSNFPLNNSSYFSQNYQNALTLTGHNNKKRKINNESKNEVMKNNTTIELTNSKKNDEKMEEIDIHNYMKNVQFELETMKSLNSKKQKEQDEKIIELTKKIDQFKEEVFILSKRIDILSTY